MIFLLLASIFGLMTVKGYNDVDFKNWGTTGKFFYVQVFYNEYNAQHYYISTGIGCSSYP